MAGLEEQLKETKEELHSQAQATKYLGLDLQRKNGTTYSDAVRKACYSCFRHQFISQKTNIPSFISRKRLR